MRIVFALMFVCSVFLPAQTTQEFPETSGNAFVRLCSAVEKDKTTDEEALTSIACVSYVKGFVAGITAQAGFTASKTKQKTPKMFCLPEDVEPGQLVRIVLKFVRNNPGDAHRRTDLLVAIALREAFPCRSK
jgi:hypothetical protein